MTRKEIKVNGSRTLYPSNTECIITLFDVRNAGAAERLGYEIVAWRERTRLYALGPQTYALVIRPGGARRLAQ